MVLALPFPPKPVSTVIKLNVGGVKYETSATTLRSKSGAQRSFFDALLDGNMPSLKDEQGYYFIDRSGRYFEVILEYLRTGELYLDDTTSNISPKILLKEAEFYGIDIPPLRQSEVISFANDAWLLQAKREGLYTKIAGVADEILAMVFKDFKKEATNGREIRSRIFMLDVANWCRKRNRPPEPGIDTEKLSGYKVVVNDSYFALLDNPVNRTIIIDYLRSNKGCTVEILHLPDVSIELWNGIYGLFHVTYYFRHAYPGDVPTLTSSPSSSSLGNVSARGQNSNK